MSSPKEGMIWNRLPLSVQYRKKADEVSGRKLKEQAIEPQPSAAGEKRTALIIIAGIAFLAVLAVFLGNRRRRNSL